MSSASTSGSTTRTTGGRQTATPSSSARSTPPVSAPSLTATPRGWPGNKLTVVGRPELVGEAERRVLSALAAEISASRSKPRFLDITAYGWHKGAVVPRLAGLCRVSREQVAVIGDGPNDVDMFKEAALSIAMGQAVDEV